MAAVALIAVVAIAAVVVAVRGGQPPPDEQESFLAVVEDGRQESAEANELRQQTILADRDVALCEAIDGDEVIGWVGTLSEVDRDFRGHASVAVDVGSDTRISTWNNLLSDVGDDTMIATGSSVFDSLLELQEGDTVRFSGSFVPGSDVSCVSGGGSAEERLEEPDFLFRFASISADD